MHQLTGRDHGIVGPEDDGARRPGKEILLVRRARADGADGAPELLRRLARQGGGRFIAFGDSRRQVELVTAVARRREADPEPEGEEIALELSDGILPYRAGYENEDRTRIQQALTEGTLRGVVATSALEMGIDIGEVDLVVLLDTPASMKSLWQRIGRAGRRNPGACIWIDGRSVVTNGDEGLAEYLSRPVEPNWLYLENRYAQFGNALCAASEIKQIDSSEDPEEGGDCDPAQLPGEPKAGAETVPSKSPAPVMTARQVLAAWVPKCPSRPVYEEAGMLFYYEHGYRIYLSEPDVQAVREMVLRDGNASDDEG
jgi:ATP-dependent helicase YprA (DUF1998 family)